MSTMHRTTLKQPAHNARVATEQKSAAAVLVINAACREIARRFHVKRNKCRDLFIAKPLSAIGCGGVGGSCCAAV